MWKRIVDIGEVCEVEELLMWERVIEVEEGC